MTGTVDIQRFHSPIQKAQPKAMQELFAAARGAMAQDFVVRGVGTFTHRNIDSLTSVSAL